MEITNIKISRIYLDNELRKDVQYSIVEGKEVLAERRENFNINTDKEQIIEELKKRKEVFMKDLEMSKATQDIEDKEKQIEQENEDLKNLTL